MNVARLAVPLVVAELVLGGSASVQELAVAGAAGLLAVVYVRSTRRARTPFHPPLRWSWSVASAVPQLGVESALLARALGAQLAGGAAIAGADDEGDVAPLRATATTSAIAAAAFPCLTPNTLVRAVRRGRVVGRRLIDAPGHALRDDLARLS